MLHTKPRRRELSSERHQGLAPIDPRPERLSWQMDTLLSRVSMDRQKLRERVRSALETNRAE